MGNRETRGAITKGVDFKEKEILFPLIALIVTASVFLMLLTMVHLSSIRFPASEFLPIHSILEIITISVSFAIFAVRWMSFRYTKDSQSLLIAVTFLSVGIIDIFHTLTYLGMPTFLGTNSTQIPTWYWVSMRLTMSLFIAVAAFLPSSKSPKYLGPNRSVAFFLIYSIIIVAFIAEYANDLPILVVQGVGLTLIKILLEYVVIIFLAIGAIKFWQLAVRTKNKSYNYLTIALFIGIFEELLFTFYGSVYDAFNFSGHIFGLLSIAFVFFALFRASVILPYEELDKARIELERKVQERTADLSETNTKLNLMNSVTRHDIANQLNVLYGFLALAKDTQDKAQINEFLEKALNGAKNIDRHIRFTKEYQEIGSKNPQWHDMQALVTKVASSYPDMRLRINSELNGVYTFADPLIEKVVYNLMHNTVVHSMKATEIRLSHSDSDGACVLIYEDDGVGIPAENKEHIFERGFGEGTGMGLWLAREILGITGITIKENGKAGKGVRFEMHVPAPSCRIENSDI